MAGQEGQSDTDEIRAVYMEQARATASVPLIFLDPDVLDREYFNSHSKTINPDDVTVVREMMDSQIAGISARYSDEDILTIAGHSIDGRRFSIQQNIPTVPDDPDSETFRFAFINLQGNNRTPTELDTAIMQSSPEAAYYWSGFWGRHEGNHAGFEHLASGHSNNFGNPGKNELLAINAELNADRDGIAWLESEGQFDLAQAVIDYRVLNAGTDPIHAAAAVLGDQPEQDATLEHFQAARGFSGAMIEAVGQDLGLSPFEVIDLERAEPDAFYGHVNRLFEDGAFEDVSGNPHIRDFIETYLGAYERRVLGREPLPQQGLDAENPVSPLPEPVADLPPDVREPSVSSLPKP